MYQSAIKVLKEIEENGFKAYIVGGYVRDHYLKRKSSDVDICTSATPKEIINIFKNAIGSTNEYGSVTLIYNKIIFEITTMRKELKYEFNRLPVKIEYIKSLKEDLLRRDFTMNTMCIDVNENVIDKMDAKKDIDNHLIKTVGPAKIKIKEDTLRILRAVRFATILDFNLDKELIRYIKKYKNNLKTLSNYRKKEELEKIFSSTNNKKGLQLIKELGLDKPLKIKNIKNIVATNEAIGVWAQLETEEDFNFTKNEKIMIKKIKELNKNYSLTNELLYENGLYISRIVAQINNIDLDAISKKYMNLPIKVTKDINIESMEICEALNILPSLKIKEVYKNLEKEILNYHLENDKEKIINYIKKNFK
ncbi:MAG: hypothetical protein RSB77_05925 [Bacilli bacterium]